LIPVHFWHHWNVRLLPRLLIEELSEQRSHVALPKVCSNLEFDANFHDLRAGNLEIRARALRVMMHEREQLLAPSYQA